MTTAFADNLQIGYPLVADYRSVYNILIAIKMIYGNNYFDTGVMVTMIKYCGTHGVCNFIHTYA